MQKLILLKLTIGFVVLLVIAGSSYAILRTSGDETRVIRRSPGEPSAHPQGQDEDKLPSEGSMATTEEPQDPTHSPTPIEGAIDDSQSATPEDLMTPIDLETAKELALEEARSHPRVEFHPEYASQSGLEFPFFTEYYLIVVRGRLHSERSYLAVGEEGVVYMLPDEFNQLVQDSGISLANSDDAQSLLELYRVLYVAGEPWTRPPCDTLILDNILDIPGLKEHDDLVTQYRFSIQPMSIAAYDEGWVFEFFAWCAADGVLSHWEVDVKSDGRVTMKRLDRLESFVGDYVSRE